MQQLNTSNKYETGDSEKDDTFQPLLLNRNEAKDTLPRAHAVRRWCKRLARGARCRWNLDRKDASPLVYTLWNFGESYAAINACKAIIASDPANVYAYIHLIDLLIGKFRDFDKAKKYYQKGISELENADSRELLQSFYLYMRCAHYPLSKLLALRSRS